MNPASRKPRAVIVTRRSLYTLLVERFGTPGQAEFYLKSRGESLSPLIEAHERVEAALLAADQALDADQRRARVHREDLERFLFEPDDLVIVVGQDGLVPNVAKYLRGQLVLGVNPDPERYDGVLCANAPSTIRRALRWEREQTDGFAVQARVMVAALREDGQLLLALNEVFVGHHSHQSARYRIAADGRTERHSSSGVIIASGTGSTGWARSIAEQRRIRDPLPRPNQHRLAWFVREPFPSVATGTALTFGYIEPQQSVRLISEMSEGGVIFADGIEFDRVEFLSGQSVEICIAEETLNLIVPVSTPTESTKEPEPRARTRHERQVR